MKFSLALCLLAITTGIVVADESKGPKVTDKVGTYNHIHTYRIILCVPASLGIHKHINQLRDCCFCS